MALNLPPNVKINPDSGTYIITSPTGKTFTVGLGNGTTEQQQQILNNYVNAVNKNTSTIVTITDPINGNPRQLSFDPVTISSDKESLDQQRALITASRRQARLIVNGDGSLQDLDTGATISTAEAQKRYVAAGLPANTSQLVNSKSPEEFTAAQNKLNQDVNNPSNILDTTTQAAQAQQGTNTTPVGNTLEPAPTAVIAEQQQIEVFTFVDPGQPIQNVSPADATQDPVINQGQFTQAAIAEQQQVAANEAIALGFAEQENPAIANQKIIDSQAEATAAASLLIAESDNAIYQQKVIDNQAEVLSAASTAMAESENAAFQTSQTGATSTRGLTGPLLTTRSQATEQDAASLAAQGDWRVRLALAPGATYLYKAAAGKRGILEPLAATYGVVFPYTPAISLTYAASYDPTELTHSNYKFFTYRSSGIDSISINCEFTAQDTFEANYLLAVIHFFRSVTKMFYGQDQNPKPGTPPPLCYLFGLGTFQFNRHPLAITSFNYTLPIDVDYIKAGTLGSAPGVNTAPANIPINTSAISNDRLAASGAYPGGQEKPTVFSQAPIGEVTYVPTKISLSIIAVPIVTRNDISNAFSLAKYGTGELLKGSTRQGGGIW